MKAIIRVTRSVVYHSIVEMSEEDFAKYEAMLDSDDRNQFQQAEKELNEMVDVNDWQGDDLDSLDDFRRWEEKQ